MAWRIPAALARIVARAEATLEDDRSIEAWPERASERPQAAAIRRLVRQPLSTLAHGISISNRVLTDPNGTVHRVGRKAAKKGTTAEDLVNDVLLHAIRPDRPGSTRDALEWSLESMVDGVPAVDLMYDVVEVGYFGFMAPEENALVLQMFAWLAAHQSPELAGAFTDLQHTLAGQVEAGVGALVERDGRRPLDDLTMKDLAFLLIALIEGSMMHYRFDKECIDAERLGAAVSALLAGLTVPADAPKTTGRERADRLWTEASPCSCQTAPAHEA